MSRNQSICRSMDSDLNMMELTGCNQRSSGFWSTFLFAEDLVAHIMKLHNIEWKPSFFFRAFRDRLETTFSADVGRAVSLVPAYFNDQLTNIKEQLTTCFLVNAHLFTSFVYYLANTIFNSDIFLEFIFFCGCVIHVAEHLFRHGHPEFLDYAVVTIVFAFDNNLKKDFEAEGSWKIFELYCFEFTSARNTACQSEISPEQRNDEETLKEVITENESPTKCVTK